MNLTQAKLKEMLSYDPETGAFTWMVRQGGVFPGQRAGWFSELRYIMIDIDGKTYKSHRLAWLWMTGHWPCKFIDHKNGVRDDNRWDNLREATCFINSQNIRGPKGRNTVLGVSPNKKRFQARISANGKKYHLGTYDTPLLAHAAYLDAKRRLHPGCTI